MVLQPFMPTCLLGATRAGDGLATLHADLLVGGDARRLGGDVRGGVLLHLDDGAAVGDKRLRVLGGGAVGDVLDGEAVGEGGGGRHEEERGGGTGSLGGERRGLLLLGGDLGGLNLGDSADGGVGGDGEHFLV